MTTSTADTLAARIDRLEAITAVLDLKHRYGELSDRLAQRADRDDLRAMGELFSDDAAVDLVAVQLAGRQAIVDLYGGIHTRIAWLWHSFHSPIIEIDGDHAAGRWTLQGVTINRDSPVPTTVYGRYVDEFIRTTAGWRISRMQLIVGPAGAQAELRLG